MTDINRKVIKINFCGCGNEFKASNNLILNILKKHYTVKISDNPDFVICGIGGNHFEYMKYNCVRILLMTENFSPDFTVFDYCIGFDYLNFGDRYFRLPFAFQSKSGEPWIPQIVTEQEAYGYLSEDKKHFCNFIYRHPSSHGVREKIFDKISEYKEITSAGNFRNNISGKTENYSNKGGALRIGRDEKLEYLRSSKFTIACESVVYPGFETEKIVDAFMMHSIPVYYGAETITETFNRKAFINVAETGLDGMLDLVKELDSNDKKYVSMLTECPLNDRMSVCKMYGELEEFLINIFSSEPVLRRPQHYYVDSVETSLKELYESKVSRNKGYKKFIRNIKRSIVSKL